VLRATVGHQYRIAVVRTGHHLPVVHAEIPHLDPGYWFDADSVDITCPHGHGWTWRTGRDLVTAHGDFTTLSEVFGPDPDAPFAACARCAPGPRSPRRILGDCHHVPRILCPTFGADCDVELPTH
jgi:hypothetical protein